jgi:molecular chaperone GrpE
MNTSQELKLTSQQRTEIVEAVSALMRDKFSLQQGLNQQQQIHNANNEELFLELLEVIDSLEILHNYMNAQLDVPSNWASLPKGIGSVKKRLLSILEKRQVAPIDFDADFQQTKPDFSLCKVVGTEARDDLENQTITKIVKCGFSLDRKILRPVEVIVSRNKDSRLL